MSQVKMPENSPTQASTNPSYLNQTAAKKQIADESVKLDAVISDKADVTIKKPNTLKKFGKEILAEDASEVKSHIVWDVMVPAVSRLCSTILHETVNAIFGSSTDTRQQPSNYTSYNSYYGGGYSTSISTKPIRPNRNRSVYDMYEVTFRGPEGREKALRALNTMREMTMNYGRCSVGHYYQLADADTRHTDFNYGWYELSRAEVIRSPRGDGWMIALPYPEPLVDGY